MTSRAARSARLLVAVAVGVLPLAGALAGGSAAAAAPATAPAAAERRAASTPPSPSAVPDDDAPLRLTVTTLAPRDPQPGGTVQVTGTLRNVGDRPATRIRVRLRVGDRLSSRGELQRADQDRPPTVRRSGTETTPVLPDLDPGASTTFDLRAPVSALRLGSVGVYPLDIEAVGSFAGERGALGIAPTYLPWFDGGRVAPTSVAVLWPLVDVPRRGPDEVMTDDGLAASLAPGGRLGHLLAVARAGSVPSCDPPAAPPTRAGAAAARVAAPSASHACPPASITYAVDPDLLYTAKAMTSPYLVRTRGATEPGTGGAAAKAWLSSLQAAQPGSDLLALPYADPDVDALTRTSSGRDDVAVARDLGSKVTQEVLRTAPLDTVAWPPAGPVTPAAVDALATGATNALVLSASAFPAARSDPGYTTGTRTTLPPSGSGTSLTGLVVDDALSGLLTGSAPGGARLAEQRFLVETAMVAAERPNLSRTLLLSLPRRGSVAGAATVNALRDIGRLPWLCPSTVVQAAAGVSRCGGAGAALGVPSRPAPGAGAVDRGALRTESAGELSPSYLRGVYAERARTLQFTDSVLKPSELTSRTKTRMRRALARTESSAWRSDPGRGRQMLSLLREDVTEQTDKVRVRGRPLLLTSSKGTLYVSVENTLDVPITIRVQFDSRTATLSTLRTPLIEVPARSSLQPSVQAAARTSGQFVVVARLLDREDVPFGAPTQVVVRSTRYGRVAVAVTGFGAGVLLIAAGVRLTRRALRARRSG